MKVIIAGSREGFTFEYVNDCLCEYFAFDWRRDWEVVSGGAKGVDSFGERWARGWNIPVKQFLADWDAYGKSAGYRRNEVMAEYADCLIAFWDGQSKGTKHMIDLALKHGLIVFVFPNKKKGLL